MRRIPVRRTFARAVARPCAGWQASDQGVYYGGAPQPHPRSRPMRAPRLAMIIFLVLAFAAAGYGFVARPLLAADRATADAATADASATDAGTADPATDAATPGGATADQPTPSAT